MNVVQARHLPNDFYAPLKARADEIERRYRELTPNSGALFERGKGVFPGGYTRDAIMRSPYAPFFTKGKGVLLTDRDGREIIDFWFNATSLPLGHAHDRVVSAAQKQLVLGTAFFGMTENEIALGELLVERVPSAERVRFTNSGSEAVMMAIRFARGFTGRDLIIKFEGAYHGTYDDVQWSVAPPTAKAGDASHPTPVADTAGLPSGEGRVLVLPYNDPEMLRAAVAQHKDRAAAIIVEPMANRMGLIMPTDPFIKAARELADACGAVLIFDEVIAFRLGYHGAQGAVGVTPDMTTLGKIIGGGFAVGALVGKAEILDISAPGTANRVGHAGTFNANPMTTAAGRATMEAMTPDAYDKINARGAYVRQRLIAMTDSLPVTISGAGSLFKINATAETLTNYRSAATAEKQWETLASQLMLIEGYMLTPALSGCVSTVTTDDHVEGFLSAFENILKA